MQPPREQDMPSQEIDLFEVVEFLGRNRVKILVCGLAGVLLAAAYSQVTPPTYEASIIVKMAQAPNTGTSTGASTSASTGTGTNTIVDVEESALLLERLKSPGAYTEKSVKACSPNAARLLPEDMASLLKVSLSKASSSVVIRVQRDSSELTIRCLDAVFEMLREQQAEQKRQKDLLVKNALGVLRSNLKEYQDAFKSIVKPADQATAVVVMGELAGFYRQINQMENLLAMGSATQLISPARPQRKSRTALLIAGGGALGVMLGIAWALLGETNRRWRARKATAA